MINNDKISWNLTPRTLTPVPHAGQTHVRGRESQPGGDPVHGHHPGAETGEGGGSGNGRSRVHHGARRHEVLKQVSGVYERAPKHLLRTNGKKNIIEAFFSKKIICQRCSDCEDGATWQKCHITVLEDVSMIIRCFGFAKKRAKKLYV